MIKFGGIKINDIYFGDKKVTEVYLGINRIWPEESTVVVTYALSDVTVRYSDGGNWVKVTGANYAYITATVKEYHNGHLASTQTNVKMTTYTSVDPRLALASGGNLYFNKAAWGTQDVEQTWYNVTFQYGTGSSAVTQTKAVLIGVNQLEDTETENKVEVSFSPTSIVSAYGSDVSVYPEYWEVTTDTYTSGESAETKTQIDGRVSIYWSFDGVAWQLPYEDVDADGSEYLVTIPRNTSGATRTVFIRVDDINSEQSVTRQFTQESIAVTLHSITWNVYGLEDTQISMALDSYMSVPDEIADGETLTFYINDTEDYSYLVYENGVFIGDPNHEGSRTTSEWIDDDVRIEIANVTGDLVIDLYPG